MRESDGYVPVVKVGLVFFLFPVTVNGDGYCWMIFGGDCRRGFTTGRGRVGTQLCGVCIISELGFVVVVAVGNSPLLIPSPTGHCHMSDEAEAWMEKPILLPDSPSFVDLCTLHQHAMRYYRLWIYACNTVLALATLVFTVFAVSVFVDPRISLLRWVRMTLFIFCTRKTPYPSIVWLLYRPIQIRLYLWTKIKSIIAKIKDKSLNSNCALTNSVKKS